MTPIDADASRSIRTFPLAPHIGRGKTIDRHALPDISAIKMWLYNRRPDRWREKVEVANTGGLIDRSPEEIKRVLIGLMLRWGLVAMEDVPPELLPLPDGTIGEE